MSIVFAKTLFLNQVPFTGIGVRPWSYLLKDKIYLQLWGTVKVNCQPKLFVSGNIHPWWGRMRFPSLHRRMHRRCLSEFHSQRAAWGRRAAVCWARLLGQVMLNLPQHAQHRLAVDCHRQAVHRCSEEAGGQPKTCPSWDPAYLLLDTSFCLKPKGWMFSYFAGTLVTWIYFFQVDDWLVRLKKCWMISHSVHLTFVWDHMWSTLLALEDGRDLWQA